MKKFNSIEAYLQQLPTDKQKLLKKFHALLVKAAPQAIQCIRYGMPTLYLHGNLVHFAIWENHIGFYPGATAIEKFQLQLSDYQTSKGAVQLPLAKPLPVPLIQHMMAFCIQHKMAKVHARSLAKPNSVQKLPVWHNQISAPANRALSAVGIESLKKLSEWSISEIGQLHGMGKSALAILEKMLQEKGHSFKQY